MGFVPAQTVPTPVVSEPAVSAPQPVKPGEEIGISIRVDSVGGTELTYEWILTEGKILEGEGTSAITYQAPMEPGTYSIRVKVTSADVTIERSTFINVGETETPGPTLTDTEQPETTDTPSPTIHLTLTLASTPILPTNTPPATDTPTVTNCNATSHTGLAQGNHTFNGVAHVAELWRANGQTPWGDKLVTAAVMGDLKIIEAGGSVWTYQEGCQEVAKREAAESVLRTGAILITEAEMRDAGLIE